MNRLKKQAYDELDSIGFDHEMKNNYPVMTLSDDAYIPFTDTAQNPPDLHVIFQGKALVLFSCLSSDSTPDNLFIWI